MTQKAADPAVMECLRQIFQAEMGGITRYLHYSFMIMGHNRIPIQKWLRSEAAENMAHAVTIGEKITALGGHPPVTALEIEETNVHTVDQILGESLKHEQHALGLYKRLVNLAADDIALEELARQFVVQETAHIEEVQKMLRRPE